MKKISINASSSKLVGLLRRHHSQNTKVQKNNTSLLKSPLDILNKYQRGKSETPGMRTSLVLQNFLEVDEVSLFPP
jgi:hypothetical protein